MKRSRGIATSSANLFSHRAQMALEHEQEDSACNSPHEESLANRQGFSWREPKGFWVTNTCEAVMDQLVDLAAKTTSF